VEDKCELGLRTECFSISNSSAQDSEHVFSITLTQMFHSMSGQAQEISHHKSFSYLRKLEGHFQEMETLLVKLWIYSIFISLKVPLEQTFGTNSMRSTERGEV